MEDLNNKKILIIRLSALGDTLHTLPLANALKQQYPDVQIDWAVEDKAAKFIIANPLLHKIYVFPRKKWKQSKNKLQNFTEFFEIIKEIRKEKYDIVIDTQQLMKSAVIMGLSAGKRKITLDDGREFSWIFSNEIIKTGKKQFDLYTHVVKRNLEIAKYLGCTDLTEKIIIPDFSAEYNQEIKYLIDNLDNTKKTIVISPATTWDNKHWHIKGWAEVIREFKDKANIILTSNGGKERELVLRILSFCPGSENITDLSGRTTIADLIYIYKKADVMLSPDSGSANCAWAAGCKSIITLFFATSAARTAPYGDNYYAVSSSKDCSPCMHKKCKLKDDINNCVYKLNSDKIINILKKVLQ